ncbi:MAG TPA: lysophospholipid acyltransferase family protein [Verrucomicrobiae bacterium]|nr:lysophospholipid acyltransferase family protein [Verrucomicrobiae bacterium]
MGLGSKLFYNCWKLLFTVIFRLIFNTRIVGRERVPRAGGLLLVCNHISFADPPLVGVASPRLVDFMAMVELFRNPLLRLLMRAVCTFPVDRSRVDHVAAREAIRRLRAGRCVCIFPEAGIRLTKQSVLGGDPVLRPGAETLALLSNAAVLPVIIRDSRKPYVWRNWFRHDAMSVTFGKPFCLWRPQHHAAKGDHQQIIREELLKTVELN